MSAILLGPAVIAAFSVVLGILISIIDRIVNNYGEVTISINGGKKTLTVNGGSKLLGTLAAENLFIPSACGGRGSCGACKVKVLSDVGPVLPTETPYLSVAELEGNVRLACQIKLKKNIEIEIPEEIFSVRRYNSTLESMVDVTYDIKELTFNLGSGAEIDFVSGQYMQLVAPAYGDVAESTQRAYSIASRPLDKNRVQLLVRLVPGGIVTGWVFKHLKVGMKVELIGPFGDFHVHDTKAAMICVAGGSGMAPFKSMFADMFERNAYPDKDIWYFFGARTTRDMFYLDELRELEKKWPRFHFIAALSEPKPEEKWEGDVGLITDVLDRYFREKIGSDKPLEGYLCGSPGMIDACVRVMTKNGIAAEDIFFDKFA